MEISKEQFEIRYKRCSQGKHKFRENSYGIVWCVNCGLLGKNCSEKLVEEDKLLIK